MRNISKSLRNIPEANIDTFWFREQQVKLVWLFFDLFHEVTDEVVVVVVLFVDVKP